MFLCTYNFLKSAKCWFKWRKIWSKNNKTRNVTRNSSFCLFQHFLKEGRKCLFNLHIIFSPVGSWDFSPLPTHTLLVSGHTSGSAGRQQHDREAGKEQTAPPISWGRREAGSWAEGCQICGVLCSDTGTCVTVVALSWHCRTEISRV